jgi:ferredoxin
MGKNKTKTVKDLHPIEISTKRANRYKKGMKLSKIPGFKYFFKRLFAPKTSNGSAIPINVSLGTYENQVLPLIVTEYFIKKASYIVLMDCPCRIANKCKNHDFKFGCTWLGKDAARIDVDKHPSAHQATVEEALERERLAYENGLVPHLGRLRADSWKYGVLPDTGHFMSLCHCCSCCCIISTIKYGTSVIKKILKRMEGVSVKVDRDKCRNCRNCFKVCIYDAMKLVDDKAMIDQETCKGCGRCERRCPNKAISIMIDDFANIEKLLARIESHVDVT